MIKLELNNNLFSVIEDEIDAFKCDRLYGNVNMKEYFKRILPDIKISFKTDGWDNEFIYNIELSEDDFIILYNHMVWFKYQDYGCILYDFHRENVRNFISYLIKVKNENKLISELDDYDRDLFWYLKEENKNYKVKVPSKKKLEKMRKELQKVTDEGKLPLKNYRCV